jgi:selenocysteine lyase/cysteine desulfurase
MTKHTSNLDVVRSRLRAQMASAGRWAYFDHAAVSPLPRPSAKVLADWTADVSENGDVNWPDSARGVEETRKTAVRLIGADADEIALVPNTTVGLNLVAEGLDWRAGDNVVTLADEFPSNVYPWMNLGSRGVETRRVPTEMCGRLDLDRLAAACDTRTRVVAVSWVGYATGYRHDLERIAAIAHERKALFVVDAIQGLGVFPLDVGQLPIDALAAGGQKWLLGPEGAGICYIRREHLARLRPVGLGSHSVVHERDYTRIELDLKPTAARYEGGAQNMCGMLALGASMRLLADLGTSNVAAAVLDITEQACQRLTEIGAKIVSDRRMDDRHGEQRSGIVAFELPGRDPLAAKKHCLTLGVVLSCRAGRLRISPHAYNNEEDLERLVAALRKFSG